MLEKVTQNVILTIGVGWVHKPTFQTACDSLGLQPEPTRRITFLRISLYIIF